MCSNHVRSNKRTEMTCCLDSDCALVISMHDHDVVVVVVATRMDTPHNVLSN